MSVQEVETVLGLLVAVVAIVAVSRRTPIHYPILLVVGGLALALIPGLPPVKLPPDLVFLLFLPPLLFVEALTAPFRDFRANHLPIFSLAFGLNGTAFGTRLTLNASADGNYWSVIALTVENGANAGNVCFQFSQTTATAVNTSILRGSWQQVTTIP